MTEENKALVSREEYQDKVIKYREKGYEYIRLLDSYLAEKTSASVTAFVQFCQEPEFLAHYVSCLPELAYAHTFAYITFCEAQKNRSPIFIQLGNSIEELTKILKKMEFRLWRVEFEGTKEAEQELYDSIRNYQLSPEVIKTIVAVAAMDRKNSYFTLACIYLEHQEVANGIQMLEYGLEEFPQDVNFLTILVQLYQKLGKTEQAAVYEERLRCAEQ